jgi:hypothetical protein
VKRQRIRNFATFSGSCPFALVKPTIEEPLRAEWELVQAEVRQIIANAKDERRSTPEARKPVYDFLDRLRRLRVLDPACGSGNFLFVALDCFKRLRRDDEDPSGDGRRSARRYGSPPRAAIRESTQSSVAEG